MDLLLVFKANLARGHGSILEEVRPRRVYHRDIVLLIAWPDNLISQTIILISQEMQNEWQCTSRPYLP